MVSVIEQAKGKNRKKTKLGGLNLGQLAVLCVPALVIFLGFVILPVIMAAYYGLFRWKGYGTPSVNGQFVGLQNFQVVITDPQFQRAVGHTFFVLIMSLVLQGPLSILFALLLNQKFKGRGLIRTLIFVPYVLSEVIVGTGWSLMLQMHGAVNQVLQQMGLGAIDWIASPKYAKWTLMFIISWKYIGFAVVLMIAGMQSIPEELYEAAEVDGAGFWQRQWSITLPLLLPTIKLWAFLSMIGSLQLFDLVYIVWGQYVSDTAGVSTMATYMTREGRLANNYGYGSAVAVVMFIISLIVAFVYQKFVMHNNLQGALTGSSNQKKLVKKRHHWATSTTSTATSTTINA